MLRFSGRSSLIFSIVVLLGISCQPKQNVLENSQLVAQLFYKIDAELGEGPIWNYETSELYWVDIEGKRLHILDPSAKSNRSFPTPSRIGTVVPINDTLAIVALEGETYIINTESGELSFHAALDSANKETRLNDGKCDPKGRLWVGSMHMTEMKADGNLYMVNGSGVTMQKLDSITISNGIVWSADKKTMYYIDTPTNKIQAFDYDNVTGEINNERTSVEIPEAFGYPDGMAIDAEGKLWVGLWNGNAIARFDPEKGTLLTKIKVPAHNVTACAFGGQELDSLFITTSRRDMTPREVKSYPDAGSVFVVVPGVKGVKSHFFKLASNDLDKKSSD